MYAQTSAYSERKDAGLSGLFADEIRTAKRTTTRTAVRVITEFGCPCPTGVGEHSCYILGFKACIVHSRVCGAATHAVGGDVGYSLQLIHSLTYFENLKEKELQ